MLEDNKKITYISVILIATLLLITGSFLIFKSSAYLSQEKIVTTLPNQNVQISIINEPIEITEELKTNLKELIPKNSCNNEFLPEQFNQNLYIGLISNENNIECSNLLTYTQDYKWSSTTDEVIMYSYVLITDGTNYGKSYQNLVVSSDKIEKLNEKISENSFIGYGGKYKFTFAKVNNDFVYTSTSYINS